MAIVTVPLKAVVAIHMDSSNEAIVPGWAICNGQTITNPNSADPQSWLQHIVPGANGSYTLPDYRNYFLIGADATKPVGQAGAAVNTADINAGAGAPGPKGTGGSNQHVLSQAQLAQHNHGNGSHSHTLTDPGHTHGVSDPSHSHGVTDPGHIHAYEGARTNQIPPFTSGYAIAAPNTHNYFVNQIMVMSGISNITTNQQTGVAVNAAGTGVGIQSALSGVSVGSAQGFLTDAGSNEPHENRPRYYGVVWIMKIRN